MTVREFRDKLAKLVNKAIADEGADGTTMWIEIELCQQVSNTTLGLVFSARENG